MTTKATQQITELTFNEEMNPYIAKYLADKAVSNCDYLLNINRNNAQGFEAKMMKELDNNPESPDESKLAEWEQGLLRAEAQQEEWKTAAPRCLTAFLQASMALHMRILVPLER